MNHQELQNNDKSIHLAYINRLTDGIDVEGMEEQERWHFERRLGIGGSDVAAILGQSPYKTTYQVWQEKTNRAEPKDLSDKDYVVAGTILEDAVAQLYTYKTGVKLNAPEKPLICRNSPWLRANLDFMTTDNQRVIECKTANAFSAKTQWGASGTDDVPYPYLLQVMHYMHVTGIHQADLAVLIGGNDFRIYPLEYNAALCEHVNQRLYDFWFNHVIADVEPEPVNLQDLQQCYPKDNGQVLLASDEVLEALQARQQAAEVKKKADEILKTQETVIKKFMGEHQILLDADGRKLASWKSQASKRFDARDFKKVHPDLAEQFYKATESRVFRA